MPAFGTDVLVLEMAQDAELAKRALARGAVLEGLGDFLDSNVLLCEGVGRRAASGMRACVRVVARACKWYRGQEGSNTMHEHKHAACGDTVHKNNNNHSEPSAPRGRVAAPHPVTVPQGGGLEPLTATHTT